VSYHTIKAWVYQGKIPFKRFGRCVKIDLRYIDKVIDESDGSECIFS